MSSHCILFSLSLNKDLLEKNFTVDTQLQHIENVGSSKDEAIKQLQQVHEDQMTKLEKVSEDKGEFWQQQKAELEEHYGQLLAELHNRQKVNTLASLWLQNLSIYMLGFM